MNCTPRLHSTKRTVIKLLLAVGGSCWSRSSCSPRLLHDRSARRITSSRNTITPAAEPEHRASWLELFFDLVVRADGAALTRVLIMYLAIWLVWTSFMLYANVAGDSTHRRPMLLAMGCIAVMAAAVPAADDFRRGQVLAVAYVVARVIASRTWLTTARVLVDWPIAQLSFGLLPWIVLLRFQAPVRYYLATQLAAAGLLDELMLPIAPVTLGAGRPLFPRPFDLTLTELAQNGAFACARYKVVGARTWARLETRESKTGPSPEKESVPFDRPKRQEHRRSIRLRTAPRRRPAGGRPALRRARCAGGSPSPGRRR